jgi:hypothetical protein
MYLLKVTSPSGYAPRMAARASILRALLAIAVITAVFGLTSARVNRNEMQCRDTGSYNWCGTLPALATPPWTRK